MKKLLIASCAIAAMMAPTAAFADTAANGYTAGTPLNLDNWAIRDVMNTVSISPNGEHILALKTESKDGEHVLEVYKTSNLGEKPIRLAAKPMEFISARWASDDYIFGTAWQVVRPRVGGPEEDVREYKSWAYNMNSKRFSEIRGSFQIISNLPKEPDHVLIATGNGPDGRSGVDPFSAFRPRAYYKYNLKTGGKSLILKGNSKHPTASFDTDGNPRYSASIEASTNELVQYFRRPGDTKWTEFGKRYDFDEHENLYRVLSGFYGFQGMKQGDPNIGYVIDAPDGQDKAALYEFDFRTGSLGKKLYQNQDADVIGVQRSSKYWSGDNSLVAAIYPGAKRERHWFDMEEKSLIEKLSKNIKNAHSVSISSRSRDGQKMIVNNRGPRDPGSYYYVDGARMIKLGSRNPTVNAADLSDVEYIRYKARDGKTIPGYVTKPKGSGPFPLVVLPHGGPHVNEVIGYDEWGQLLANNGYMVLQPQYRMSTGWGKDHFDSAFGQHGLAMQDDKDDGAKYLISKGMVDPDRVAMFGWSYGGYAALVATQREDNIYQCAIAGAAVADAKKVYLKRKGVGSPKALDDWSRARGGFVGVNPIENIDKVNIPLLMVHGDVDARVLYFNYKDYKKSMDKAGKEGDYLTLKGADHYYSTLMYNHQKDFFTKMLDYLKNDCGPGGL